MDYSHPQLFAAIAVNAFVVALSVIIHYEFLFRTSVLIRKIPVRFRLRIVLGVIGALIAHTVEVWVFAVAYYWLIAQGSFGELTGNFGGTLLDCLYFSFTTFSTLGFGDIEPSGYLRFLTGIESLTGLVLITWTASFLYYEMQECWVSN